MDSTASALTRPTIRRRGVLRSRVDCRHGGTVSIAPRAVRTMCVVPCSGRRRRLERCLHRRRPGSVRRRPCVRSAWPACASSDTHAVGSPPGICSLRNGCHDAPPRAARALRTNRDTAERAAASIRGLANPERIFCEPLLRAANGLGATGRMRWTPDVSLAASRFPDRPMRAARQARAARDVRLSDGARSPFAAGFRLDGGLVDATTARPRI